MPGAWWQGSERRWTAGAAAIWAGAGALVLYRLPFGANTDDEAFYSAMPYSFLLGNKPYKDELGVFQNAGILQEPLFRVYVAVAGSADGIIMFNRYLYFTYLLVCSVIAFGLARRISNTMTACCAGALVVTFSYFNLFALSYNTCGAFGFFLGVLCTAYALLHARPGKGLFGASLLLLSALFSYAALTPVVALYLGIVLVWLFRCCSREARVNGLLGLGAGAVVAALAGWAFISRVGQAGITRLLEFNRGMGYGTQSVWARLNVFHAIATQWHWIPLGFAGLFVALPFVYRLLPRAPWLVAALTVLGFGFVYWSGLSAAAPTKTTILLSAVPLLTPLCVALNPSWKYGRFVLWLLWAPSAVAMLTIAYTSSNWYHAACLGALGALLSGVLSFAAFLERSSEAEPGLRGGARWVFAAFFVCLLSMQLHSLFATVYPYTVTLGMSEPFPGHHTRVHRGPARGTLATAAQAAFLEAIDGDLKQSARSGKTLTILDDLPIGYLSTRLRPKTFTHWIIWGFLSPQYSKSITKQYFGDDATLPDLLLEVHVNALGRPYWEPYLRHKYRVLLARPEYDYVILRKKRG